jgi:hypothetical protein
MLASSWQIRSFRAAVTVASGDATVTCAGHAVSAAVDGHQSSGARKRAAADLELEPLRLFYLHAHHAGHLRAARRAQPGGPHAWQGRARAAQAHLLRRLPRRRAGERGDRDGVVGVGVQAGLHAQAERGQQALHRRSRHGRRPHHALAQPLRRACARPAAGRAGPRRSHACAAY